MISRFEQETIINYNAAEQTATVYTRDKTVMRRLDALVIVSRGGYRRNRERRRGVGLKRQMRITKNHYKILLYIDILLKYDTI